MHRDRLTKLRSLLESVPDDDRLFNVYGFLGKEGTYDAAVVACRDPGFQKLGLSLDKEGFPIYDSVHNSAGKDSISRGMEAMRIFFNITIVDTRRIFGPLYYDTMDPRPSDVRKIIQRVIFEASEGAVLSS